MNTTITPVGSLTAGEVREVLTAATAAPSLHNTQPWRFHCTPGAIELHADTSRALEAADPEHRELVLACGAALLNLRLAIRASGTVPDVRTFPEPGRPDLLATVRPAARRPATPAERELAAAIPRRRTNRRPFHHDPVPAVLQASLRQAAEAERGWLAVLDPPQRLVLCGLSRQAHQEQLDDPEFVAEWQRWTGRTGDVGEGVPARSSGPVPEPQDEFVLRDFGGGGARTRVAGKDFEPEPLICVLGSFQDSRHAQLQAGMAMQRVLLTATANGLASSFLSQVVEVANTRRELRALIGSGLWPQIVLRIGYGSPVPATPRRPLDEVVTGELAPNRSS
ncbi:nitroreductase family protein [Saccharopolyspora indica]|uniref:Acg family FMN-binding oxidoreductase n=1 Tax=Saccharopolyspora indica TaxID=1229659 RepID=UPI0022EB7283|nr:nitroreductase family protein [Saccharopolyspora indica]MDA3645696.1 nitroreductase family protein [Saccharopolyspora indica]